MRIVWHRADGGVSVTMLTPEAMERVAWATSAENQTLLASKDALVARKAELEQQAGAYGALVVQRDAAVKDGATLDVIEATQADAEALAQTLADAAPEYAEAVAKLSVVARVEEVRDTIGLDEHAHELLLQARGDVPATHVCIGHSDMTLPVDDQYRNAWVFDGKAVVHDMDKAREIHKDLMRAARALKFPALDVQAMRAQEQGNVGLADVAKLKQQLRDVPGDPRIVAATTLDELRAVWPDCLK